MVTIHQKREKLHQFIDVIEAKKVDAMYNLFETEIEVEYENYSDSFKNELDKRYADFSKNDNGISEIEANKQIDELLKTFEK